MQIFTFGNADFPKKGYSLKKMQRIEVGSMMSHSEHGIAWVGIVNRGGGSEALQEEC